MTLAAANESQWELGANSSHWMGVLRYGVDLPQDGSVSIGYADRLGNSSPGKLLVMNLDLTLGNWRNQRISLLGWASLADTTRTSLGHQADGGGWHLEQSNLLLMLNHPFNPRWSMDVGAGSRWMADSARQHSAGWQAVFRPQLQAVLTPYAPLKPSATDGGLARAAPAVSRIIITAQLGKARLAHHSG
jgi:hypothetical protein